MSPPSLGIIGYRYQSELMKLHRLFVNAAFLLLLAVVSPAYSQEPTSVDESKSPSMRFVARKDQDGNVIGFDALDENGNVIDGANFGNRQMGQAVEAVPLPHAPLPTFEGDYRSPSERRAQESAIEEQRKESTEPQTRESIEPQIPAQHLLNDSVITTRDPNSQPQTLPAERQRVLPTMLLLMAIITLTLLSLVLIGVLRKQSSIAHLQRAKIERAQPTKNENSIWLWSLYGVALYFIVTKVIIPTVVLNTVDGTEQIEVKFIP